MVKKHLPALEEDEELNRTLLPRNKRKRSKLPLILRRTLRLKRSWIRHVLLRRHHKENKAKSKVLADEDDWFDKSFLVQGIASEIGVDENTVKQNWRLAPMEVKKTIEEDMRVLRAMVVGFILLKISLLYDIASLIREASN